MKELKNTKPSGCEAEPLVVVGTVAIDGVTTPFGSHERVFGGSASYFSYAASLFSPVSLVAVVGRDFPQEYREILSERPIETSHLKTLQGDTFFWKGRYEGDMNVAITEETRLNVLLDFDPKIHYDNHPECLFLANIDPSLQLKVLDQLKKPRLKWVACDTMNFWIESKRKELLEVLARIDCIVLNDMETRMLTGETNLIRGAQKIRDMGPAQVVIKKGEHGVLLFYGNQFFALPAYPLENVCDPTGAGDSFAGGMAGYLTSVQEFTFDHFKKAIAIGSVTASFTVEDFGLEALRRTDRAKLLERLDLFRRMTNF